MEDTIPAAPPVAAENNRDSGYIQTQPDITYLKAYGCQAYPLTREAQEGIRKRDLKTQPHAEVGYLVVYDSTNIFRIWIPERQEVRRVRDVTFNETHFYDTKNHFKQLTVTESPSLQLPEHVESDSESDEAEASRQYEHRRQMDLEYHSESEFGSTIEVVTGSQDVEQQSYDPKDQVPYPTPEPESSIRGTQLLDEQDHQDEDASETHGLRRSARRRKLTKKGKEFS